MECTNAPSPALYCDGVGWGIKENRLAENFSKPIGGGEDEIRTRGRIAPTSV